jgi:hypothetical protein
MIPYYKFRKSYNWKEENNNLITLTLSTLDWLLFVYDQESLGWGDDLSSRQGRHYLQKGLESGTSWFQDIFFLYN